MADNINVDPGTTAAAVPVYTDEVGGAHVQVIKLATGGDGVATFISAANPVPISDAGGSITVDGTVAVTGISSTAPDRGAGATTAQTLRVSIASEQVDPGKYEAVPSTISTTTTLGATGATGDFLSALVVTPLTTSPGSISIKDGSDTAILLFAGGATSVSNLVPFTINIGATSRTGAWQVVAGWAATCRCSASGISPDADRIRAPQVYRFQPGRSRWRRRWRWRLDTRERID